jgi:hypothetical protein
MSIFILKLQRTAYVSQNSVTHTLEKHLKVKEGLQ